MHNKDKRKSSYLSPSLSNNKDIKPTEENLGKYHKELTKDSKTTHQIFLHEASKEPQEERMDTQSIPRSSVDEQPNIRTRPPNSVCNSSTTYEPHATIMTGIRPNKVPAEHEPTPRGQGYHNTNREPK